MHPKRSLREDQGGAVVLCAVFMAAFMVGCLWYVIGIGDAILHREQMQAGADAVAFSSAVYHARGMNLVAFINLMMAAVIASITAAKALQIIVSGVMLTATVTCLLPDGGFACNTAKEAAKYWAKLKTIISNLEANSDDLLRDLSKEQKDIALVTPWAASWRSTESAQKYVPLTTRGIAVSMSMVPNGEGRYGLPIMTEPFPMLCLRGKKYMADFVIAELKKNLPPDYADFGSAFSYSAIKDIPVEFCSGLTSAKSYKFFDPEDLCQEQRDQYEKTHTTPPDPEFDVDACEDVAEEMEKNPPKEVQELPKPGEITPIDPSAKTTKMISSNARNGNDYFQVYALTVGSLGSGGTAARLRGGDKAVKIPAWNKEVTIDSSNELIAPVTNDLALENIAIAEAEFYYDQTPTAVTDDLCWTDSGCGLTWDSYKDNVLWNMRWRARLRRVHQPTGAAAGEFNVLASAIPDPPETIGSFKGKANGAGEFSSWNDFATGPRVGALFDYEVLRSALRNKPEWGGANVDPFIQNSSYPPIIH